MIAYRSTLEKTKAPVSRVDFRDAGALTINEIECHDLIDDEQLYWWNQHVGVKPDEFASIFTRNFSIAVEVDVVPHETGVDLCIKSKAENSRCDGRAFEGTTSIHLDDIERAPESNVRVDKKFQGNGMGTSWMKSVIEANVLLGKKNYRFLAGHENGANTWSRFGAVLDMSPSMKDRREFFSKRVEARLHAMEEQITPLNFNVMSSMVKMDRPDSFADIHAFDTPLEFGLVRKFDGARAGKAFETIKRYAEKSKNKHMQKHPSGVFARTELTNMKEVFDVAVERKKDPTLVQCLYSRTVAPAVIDFSNAKQMEKIGHYVGGWSAITPV